jgi:ribonuclease HI
MAYDERVVLYFDGASRNNPHGPAAYGWVLYAEDHYGNVEYRINAGSGGLGYDVSNNQAEYAGLVAGLTYVRNHISCDDLCIRGDSELVINQMNQVYEVRNPNLKRYYNQARQLLGIIDCTNYWFEHISRAQNSEADNLANRRLQGA